jgi:hypothetical protein
VFLLSLVAVCGVGIASNTAQSQQEERKFEDMTSDHVPIKVKLKNEQTFKKMSNKEWARELEIEVKNTGNKPIYFMYMNIIMREMLSNDYPLAFQLSYGRKDLVRFTTPIEPEDVPIRPGESVTLKVSESQAKAYEEFRDREKKIDSKKIEFDLQLINFGDGTGLRSPKGHPIPDPAIKQSLSAPRRKQGSDADPPLFGRSMPDSSGKLLESFYSSVPASFSRVNFYPPEEVPAIGTASVTRDLCGCQNSNDCMFGIPDYASCPCDDPQD